MPTVAIDREAIAGGAERLTAHFEVDVQIKRENTRTLLALGFTAIFGLTLIIAALGAFYSPNWINIADFLQIALPAETALLGSAVGFYFGSKAQQ